MPEEDELRRLRREGPAGLARVLAAYERPLRRMIQFRIDRRLRGRLDPADVLQEAYLCLSDRLDEFLSNPRVPLYVWMRQIVSQVLVDVQRRHLGAKMRDARREVQAHKGPRPQSTVFVLANQLAADLTPPSQVAIRQESLERLYEVLDRLDDIDREVLALRHFEELDNQQAAQVLGIRKSAASNRYVRALKRLRAAMGNPES